MVNAALTAARLKEPAIAAPGCVATSTAAKGEAVARIAVREFHIATASSRTEHGAARERVRQCVVDLPTGRFVLASLYWLDSRSGKALLHPEIFKPGE
jgi:hypothetical protein